MDNSDGCIVGIMWILTIGISIGSGIFAWNWIEPESFLGAIAFLIAWAALSKIGHIISMGIVAIFGGLD